jgi:tripartite-type tricarboxylate transporter receptor subunit TctC
MTGINRRKFGLSAAAALCAPAGLLSVTAARAAGYPEREITMVVNFGAGGVTDLMSRALARGMEAKLGKPVVVTNRPGALGTLGPGYVAKQKPDGYTLATVSASATTITPHLMNVAFQPSDLQFIAGYGINRYGIVVRADSPYKSVEDVIKAAKGAKSMMFGSPSMPNSLLLFLLGKQTGARFELVQYKSGPEAASALIGGQVELIVPNPPDVVSHIKSGRLRLLASASTARWPEFPDVPTLKESGYNVAYDAWVGLAAPAGTPADVIAKLQDAVEASVNDSKSREAYANVGAAAAFMPGAEYTAFLAKERAQMKQLIEEVGVKRVS